MKVSVLGATGQTGQYLITQALQQGHHVTALVRSVGKIAIQHENLKVVEANVFSAESLTEHFQDQDAIVSCLGFPYKLLSAISGYTDSMTAIVTAMRQAKVNRLVAMTSWYTDSNSRQNAPAMVRALLLPLIRSVLNNMHEMENNLETDCSDLNWTVVRPPGLQNVSATDKEFVTHEGCYVPGDNNSPATNTVARGDVARFMLLLLENNEWTRKAVAMCTN
ncbi:flavin reductase (NADPH)-like [Ambystoma mexicanum]|uniref:flavin reductase (NADPH)-like n=1 Tax=Ambystoma mexicanum TaxID=8296 RepID=UPI0037E8C7FA